MLEPRAELVLDAHADVGESPVWDIRASQLIWIDVTAQPSRSRSRNAEVSFST